MADRGPRVLQTLPADGLVAEEIIGAMREEYGYPATPQEYRLTLRIAPDEAERQNARRRREPAAPAEAPAESTEEADDAEEASDLPREGVPPARRGRLRRRRRGRGRAGGPAGVDRGEPATGGPGGDSRQGSPGDSPQDSRGESPGGSPGADPGGGEPAGG